MLKCIIIDDEPLALRQLKSYLMKYLDIELVASFRSAIEAGNFLYEQNNMNRNIDLIFCDINMPEMSGVEFVRKVIKYYEATTFNNGELQPSLPMVIFTTAYAEYAVEGFRLDAVDYLLKPFTYNDLERSVKRAQSLYDLRHGVHAQGEVDTIQTAEVLEKSDDNAEYISVKADYKVTMVKLSDIIYMESEGEYVRMHIMNHRPITTLFRLKNMEAQLPDSQFIRTHRSYIVNINRVVSYERGRVYLSHDEYIPIGQNYKDAFLNAMESRSATITL